MSKLSYEDKMNLYKDRKNEMSINSHNGELLGKWGNFINRTLKFINKSFDGSLSKAKIEEQLQNKFKELYKNVGENIEKTPWILVKENKQKCNDVLFNCCNIIYNVNTLLKPYLPFTCDKVDEYLRISNSNWGYKSIDKVDISNDIKPLYERYDKKIIDEEISKL